MSEELQRGKPRTNGAGHPPNGQQIDLGSIYQAAPMSFAQLELDCDAKGNALTNLTNAVKVLSSHPDLLGHVWFDEFHGRIFQDLFQDEPREWADHNAIALTHWMQSQMRLSKMLISTVNDAVDFMARIQIRNEPVDWLNTLKWDGRDRLAYLMSDGFGAPYDHYTAAVGRCFIMGIVARLLRPGCQLDYMPVLEGAQGAGKSTGLAILGGKWFAEAHESVTSKDFFQALSGKMLLEISELHAFRRAEITRIKGVISCPVDRYRASYGRFSMDHPRRCAFAGTTNLSDWNADETGARRFWPIACTEVSRDWLAENRDALFAEATARFRAGESWWDVPQERASEEQEERRDADAWEEPIEFYLRGKSATTVNEILASVMQLDLAKRDKSYQMRVARALSALGWIRVLKRIGGKPMRVWIQKKSPVVTGGDGGAQDFIL